MEGFRESEARYAGELGGLLELLQALDKPEEEEERPEHRDLAEAASLVTPLLRASRDVLTAKVLSPETLVSKNGPAAVLGLYKLYAESYVFLQNLVRKKSKSIPDAEKLVWALDRPLLRLREYARIYAAVAAEEKSGDISGFEAALSQAAFLAESIGRLAEGELQKEMDRRKIFEVEVSIQSSLPASVLPLAKPGRLFLRRDYVLIRTDTLATSEIEKKEWVKMDAVLLSDVLLLISSLRTLSQVVILKKTELADSRGAETLSMVIQSSEIENPDDFSNEKLLQIKLVSPEIKLAWSLALTNAIRCSKVAAHHSSNGVEAPRSLRVKSKDTLGLPTAASAARKTSGKVAAKTLSRSSSSRRSQAMALQRRHMTQVFDLKCGICGSTIDPTDEKSALCDKWYSLSSLIIAYMSVANESVALIRRP
jgi:hypothetical protein